MKCSHKMCDLCGTRQCVNSTASINRYGRVNACNSCVTRAVHFSYEACCTWGGTVIDVNQPCGKPAHV